MQIAAREHRTYDRHFLVKLADAFCLRVNLGACRVNTFAYRIIAVINWAPFSHLLRVYLSRPIVGIHEASNLPLFTNELFIEIHTE